MGFAMGTVVTAPRLYLPEAVGEILDLSVSTLATLRVRGGGPPFVKIGSRVFYPAEALERWIADRPLLNSTSELPPTMRRPGAGRKSRAETEAPAA